MAVFFIHRLFYVLPNPLNRIIAATDNTQRFGLSNLKYDKNGNITHLTRGGHLKEMPDWDKDDDFGTMDQLDYQYFDGSNRLRSVTDGILKNDTSGKGEFVDGNKDGDDYVYDPNGNMTQDLNKGIKGTTPTEKGIEYNHLNLPTKVSIDDGGANKGTISYIYDATGVKLRKNVLIQGETTPTATDYAGNYIYENGTLQFFSTPEGYVEPNSTGGYDYIYQYKDHLGNVRLSYKDNNGTIEIVEENNYYPFGLEHKGYNNVINGTEHPYKYQGKEHEEELGLNTYDFSARNYMPDLGRWTTLDPLAELDYSLTSYNYAMNNPVLFTDPTGLSTHIKLNDDGEWEVVEGGNPDDDDDNIYIIAYDEDGNAVNTGLSIGESLTSHSFYNENEEGGYDAVVGAIIDLGSTEGQDFIDDEIIAGDPFIGNYMPNATRGGDYDFKRRGIKDAKKEGKTELQHKYRGSVASNGKIGSARDFGNGGAGIVAGRFGLSWRGARLGFDALETKQHSSIITIRIPDGGTIIIPNINFTSEKAATQKAQRLGWEIGIKLNQEDGKIDFFNK